MQTDNLRPHYESLGKLTVSFSHLELQLQFLFYLVSGKNSHVTEVITAQLSFQRLVVSVKELYLNLVTDETRQQNLSQVLGLALKLEGERNKFIHSIWMEDRSPDATERALRTKITLDSKKGLRRQIEHVNVSTLETLAADILECSYAVEKITMDLYELLKDKSTGAGGLTTRSS
jgi:hypothetical protein